MFDFLARLFGGSPDRSLDGALPPQKASGILRSASSPICLRRIEDGQPLVVDECYVRIEVNRAHIPFQRIGTQRYHGCIHSAVSLIDARKQGTIGFQTVSSSALAEKDSAHADRILIRDFPVLSCAAYRGDVRLQLGLMSVESQGGDMVAPYLSLLKTMSDAAGVSIVSQAMHFVRPIQEGLNLLLGAHKGLALEVGLDASTEPLISGRYLLIRDEPDKVEDYVFDDDLYVGTDKSIVTGAPYVIFSVRKLTHRNDWRTLPDLAESHRELMRVFTARTRNQQAEQSQLVHFERTCIASPDLIPSDARAIIASEKSRYQATIVKHEPTAASGRPEPWTLDELEPFPQAEEVV